MNNLLLLLRNLAYWLVPLVLFSYLYFWSDTQLRQGLAKLDNNYQDLFYVQQVSELLASVQSDDASSDERVEQILRRFSNDFKLERDTAGQVQKIFAGNVSYSLAVSFLAELKQEGWSPKLVHMSAVDDNGNLLQTDQVAQSIGQVQLEIEL